MGDRQGQGLWAALAWVAFPALPLALEAGYHGTLTFSGGGRLPPDPFEWRWVDWVLGLGPLIGFGFLAGATVGLPDGPAAAGGRWRWVRGWLSRRWVWVGVGPWAGALAWWALLAGYSWVGGWLPKSFNQGVSHLLLDPPQTRAHTAALWAIGLTLLVTVGYGWLAPAAAALRRARRAGSAAATLRRGAAWALAFVGSLLGSFWAVTEGWRGFFFDPKVMPVVLAALSVATLSGCSSTITYGEARRRELFHAMLLAWTVGLALLWQWRGRSKTR